MWSWKMHESDSGLFVSTDSCVAADILEPFSVSCAKEMNQMNMVS